MVDGGLGREKLAPMAQAKRRIRFDGASIAKTTLEVQSRLGRQA
jgi:hypothetical protein